MATEMHARNDCDTLCLSLARVRWSSCHSGHTYLQPPLTKAVPSTLLYWFKPVASHASCADYYSHMVVGVHTELCNIQVSASFSSHSPTWLRWRPREKSPKPFKIFPFAHFAFTLVFSSLLHALLPPLLSIFATCVLFLAIAVIFGL